jgi:hypothetical protein
MAMDNKSKLKGRPIAADPNAPSTEPGVPAFIAKLQGAPVYFGFAVLEDVVVEGFTLGEIADFEAEPTDYGDSFVIAPDGSRCGLVWEVTDSSYFQQVISPEMGRWGVWGVSFPFPMDSRTNARRNLESILPKLKKEWMAWRERYQTHPQSAARHFR